MASVQLRQVRKSYDGKTSVIHGIDYIGCASDLGLMMRQCAAVLASIRSQQVHVNTAGY